MDVGSRPLAAPLVLAEGAVLEAAVEGVKLLQNGEVVQTVRGTLAAVPVASADGRTVAVSVTTAGGRDGALVTLTRQNGRWQSQTRIQGNHTLTRLAMDPSGERLAFVWPGPRGGVAAVYLLNLQVPDATPERLTNRAPRRPGQPPDDFVALPLRDPPVFDGSMLRWTADDGPHSVRLP